MMKHQRGINEGMEMYHAILTTQFLFHIFRLALQFVDNQLHKLGDQCVACQSRFFGILQDIPQQHSIR